MPHLDTDVVVDVPHPARHSPLRSPRSAILRSSVLRSCGTRAFGRLLPLAVAMNGVSGPELAKKHKHRANIDPGAIHTVLVKAQERADEKQRRRSNAGEATQESRSNQHTRHAVVSIHRPDVPNYEELLVPMVMKSFLCRLVAATVAAAVAATVAATVAARAQAKKQSRHLQVKRTAARTCPPRWRAP